MKVFVAVLFIVYVSQHASAVVVVVDEGAESVVLPCQVEGPLSSNQVVWRRSDPSMTVHERRDGRDQPNNQNEVYRGRTALRPDAEQSGNLSLTLKNINLVDAGTYTCSTCEVQLHVISRNVSQHASAVVVEVSEGVESVVLPCRVKGPLSSSVVEWRRSNPSMTVHVRRDGRDQPNDQNELYRGRTELRQGAQDSQNLSLTLKSISLADAGTYTCSSCEVQLQVISRKVSQHASAVMVDEGAASVVLPCQVKGPLSSNLVVWRRSDPSMTVHLHRDGREQPNDQDEVYRGRTELRQDAEQSGNLSLTLRNISLMDAGTYTCFTSQRFIMLGQAEVQLYIISRNVSQHASAAVVDEGAQSVVLPCQVKGPLSSSLVVWRRSKPTMTVHLRRDGRDQPNDQNKLYRGRTALRQDAEKSGDLSLTLRNISLVDAGTYTCFTSQSFIMLGQAEVQLYVVSIIEAQSRKERNVFMGLFIVTLLLLVGCIGYIIWMKKI